MTSDFAPELAKYHKSSPKPAKIAQNGDLENDARYARNFVALIGNQGCRNLPSKNMTSDFVPKLANPKIVQNSVQAYTVSLC